MKEVWKDIPGYEGYYQASSLGEIKSVTRKTIYREKYVRVFKEKVIKQRISTNYYLIVNLNKEGVSKTFCVHILVTMAFLNHTSNQVTVVDHRNDIKTDNRVENLRIISKRENNNKHPRGKVKYVGVVWDKRKKLYQSTIFINGIHKHLGFHDTPEQASSEYKKALAEINLHTILKKEG